MGVRIITDSTSDISLERAKELGVKIMPLVVIFGENSYKDGIEITNDEFYEKLKVADSLPTTSQVTVGEFKDVFKEALEAGDSVVCITIAKELSGTYQSAEIAKNQLKSDDIYLVDSRSVTLGEALIVEKAVDFRDEGLSAAEISDKLNALKEKLYVLAAIDDITYLKKGGRLSMGKAVVASVLNIKPIVSVLDGKISSFEKGRGIVNALQTVVDEANKLDIDLSLPTAVADAQSPENHDVLEKLLIDKFSLKDLKHYKIGTVVGAHGGPGCTGFSFFIK